MKKLVGTYRLGGINTNIYWSDGWGGEFTLTPTDTALPEIVIGFASLTWNNVVIAALHELMEFEMHMLGLRFDRTNDAGNDHAGYVFHFDHPQLSDVCSRVGVVLANLLPKLAKCFAEYKKKHKKGE